VGDKRMISKLDAAREQIRTAILIWFNEGSTIAIHTLAAAAHEIVHALYVKKGLVDLLLDTDLVKPQYRSYWIGKVREDANFFKHADRDPDALLEFDPFVSEAHIVFALLGLRRMGEVLGIEEDIFMKWEALHRPELMREDIYAEVLPEAVEKLRLLSKQQFLEVFLRATGKPSGMGKTVGNFSTRC
jgi:hypothetical protein